MKDTNKQSKKRTTKSVSKIRFHIDNQRSNMEGFPGSSAVKNLPANAGVAGSVPVSGRSPGEGMATHSRILAWRIPWTEEPGGLQSMGSQKSRTRPTNETTVMSCMVGTWEVINLVNLCLNIS